MSKGFVCMPCMGAASIDEVTDGVEALDVHSLKVGSLLAGSAPQHFPAGSSYVGILTIPTALIRLEQWCPSGWSHMSLNM